MGGIVLPLSVAWASQLLVGYFLYYPETLEVIGYCVQGAKSQKVEWAGFVCQYPEVTECGVVGNPSSSYFWIR